MAGSSLLPKILPDFPFGFYLLTSLPARATNHMQGRCMQAKKQNEGTIFEIFKR